MRQTGIDEPNIFFAHATSADKPANPAAMQASDLNLLRSIVGVTNAYATNSFPSFRWRLVDGRAFDERAEDSFSPRFILFWR
jgi:hypothetical protein